MKLKHLLISLLLFFVAPSFAVIHIIAAENNYGAIAKMIGGDAVTVTSILNNPNQDPHLFSVNVKTHALLNTLTAQDIVLINGAGYDAWAEQLVRNTGATVINVAALNQVPEGANPHLWYDLSKMDLLVKQLATQLTIAEPNKKAYFAKNRDKFLGRSKQIQSSIHALRAVLKNAPVIATEPVANYLTDQLGLNMHAAHFQLNVMNDVEPSIEDRTDFLRALHKHQVKLLIYNRQVTNPVTSAMRSAAECAGIPVFGVNELLPADQKDFLAAYQENLNGVQHILVEENHAKTNHCV